MTTADACALLVAAVRDTSLARRQRDDWRLVALVALDHVTALERQLQMLDAERVVCRSRSRALQDAVYRQLEADVTGHRTAA